MTQLSITSDYFTDHGDPSPYLRKIAEAGFTHIHWCHHWRSDFLYSRSEIDQIGHWLTEYGLQLNDVHGSEGIEKFWYSPYEYARQAGVELVKNRLEFAARLGGDAIVMHAYPPSKDPAQAGLFDTLMEQMRKTLDEVQPYAADLGVSIAIENLVDAAGLYAGTVEITEAVDNFDLIETLLTEYPPEFLGLCYDSGHAHLGRNRMERLDAVKDRLIVLHLHDNDGTGDDHRLPFQDTIDWERLAGLIAGSPYNKPLSFEVSIHKTGIDNEEVFLAEAQKQGVRFAEMVQLTIDDF